MLANRTKSMTIGQQNKSIPADIDITYISIETIVAIFAVTGNLLVIIVFIKYPSIRTTTNYYVMSLAIADLLVGLIGIPFAITTSLGLPTNFHACLFTNSLLLLLCTGSIFSLVAVSIDRFWAIRWPFTYTAHMTKKASLTIISVSWLLAAVVGLLPLMGWNAGRPKTPSCFFMEVMDMKYLATLYFGTILLPMAFMALVYGFIFHAVTYQIQRTCSQMMPGKSFAVQRQCLNAQARAAKILAVIILLFCISWIPLYTFNTVKCFCPDCSAPPALVKFLIVLTHSNSAWNPILYAWGIKDFKQALRMMCSKNERYQHKRFAVIFEAPSIGHEKSSKIKNGNSVRNGVAL